MDVSSIAAVATQMSQARTADAVSMTVLKKALDLEAMGAAQLVQAVTQSIQAASNPANLGNQVDTFA